MATMNSEIKFYNIIENSLEIIFDVGCRNDSIFLTSKKEVHYFEPNSIFYNEIKSQNNKNTKSFFNNFGLGSKNENLTYYTNYQSFYDRSQKGHLRGTDPGKEIVLEIKNSSEYLLKNNINFIDFLKIDTEGYDFEVIKGFKDTIKKIKIIQFEYGGCFIDADLNLVTVINYLKSKGFDNFFKLQKNSITELKSYEDNFSWCNIVCFNNDFNIFENFIEQIMIS